MRDRRLFRVEVVREFVDIPAGLPSLICLCFVFSLSAPLRRASAARFYRGSRFDTEPLDWRVKAGLTYCKTRILIAFAAVKRRFGSAWRSAKPASRNALSTTIPP